ncbi:MAG: MG2 domain-containing protein, partial [Planctomycetota bacterium]
MPRSSRIPVSLALLVLVFLAGVLTFGTVVWSEDAPLEKADALFEAKNYAEAAQAYHGLLEADEAATVRHASRRIVLCELRLRRFDAALEAAQAYVGRVADTPFEARAERLAGNLWLLVPHWGTRSGGTFHRAQWGQGIQLRSWRHDKKRALGHLQRARNLYAAWDAPDRAEALAKALPAKEASAWHEERLECLFDLAGACARFGIYENGWSFWFGSWGVRDDARAQTAGEEDFDEYRGDWELRRKRPIGLRLDAAGRPIFPTRPAAWAADLGDDPKILWLLQELRDLDRSENRDFSARSTYRQAMLARARFGMDRLRAYAGMYGSGNRYPLQEDLEHFEPWTLGDEETLVLAGGQITKVDLPPEWDVLGLLRSVVSGQAKSTVAPQAQYAVGLTYQSRQQYDEALSEYETLQGRWPKSKWANIADTQIERIRRPQVHVNQMGVQLAGEPARLQIVYRNTKKVYFVARRIDLEAFLREIRDQPFDVLEGPRGVWALQNWSTWFTRNADEKSFAHQVARRHVGEVVARWADEVEDDGSHRYAQARLQTPIDAGGAYLVQAYLRGPPVDDVKVPGDPTRQGDSRAVLVLSDLALVEKTAKGGKLYFVADARTGAPVANAKVDVVEFWSVWHGKERKSYHYREAWAFETDARGLALDPPRERVNRGPQHVLVKVGTGKDARLAWGGMRYWQPYTPSRMQQGTIAYCITDRPVYRPNQQVRYKVWVRQKRQGLMENARGRSFTVQVYDPRGNVVHNASHQTDGFGGFDGSFTLGEEPKLGVYRLKVVGSRWEGGQNFRVEEYKKPEFEVTVEPSATHAKLGQVIEAKIKATYYFGAPVIDAEVTYKVFREEYRHRAYPRGAWDWLYGPGYGLAWYDYSWFPWWRWVSSCRVAPPWWWGFFGQGAGGGRPVRELVKQGSARIGQDGTLSVEIDTKPALRDHGDLDHRYVVEAEVRDASRRVIAGEGAVTVTRRAYYATVDLERGWTRPGEELVAHVRCVTPDGKPVQVDGVVTISQVRFGGRGNATIDQQEVKRWKASTDERGELVVRLRPEKSGQVVIRFEAPDAWGGTVEGYGTTWILGEDFDGSLYRFNDLELITDKRTYRPGETAHVMVSTKRLGSWVLFADRVDRNAILSWRMLHLPNRTTVVDVPIEKAGVPNFFVEALTVSDTRTHEQVKRICVPPIGAVLDVTVETDEGEYRPGEKATVVVKARAKDGAPADAQVVVSAFDKSVLYIQPEYTPPIAKFFHGNLRFHRARSWTSLVEQFASWG